MKNQKSRCQVLNVLYLQIDIGESILPSDLFPLTGSGQENTNNSNTTVPPEVKDAKEVSTLVGGNLAYFMEVSLFSIKSCFLLSVQKVSCTL